MRGKAWAMAFLVLAPGVSFAGTADDDLAVVKKAVAQSSPPAPDPASPRAEASRSEKKMRWLKIRVTEKEGKRVSINLPLSFARALGEDWPVNLGCRKGGSRVTLGEILRSLEEGQNLVEVDSEDAKVRVWVE